MIEYPTCPHERPKDSSSLNASAIRQVEVLPPKRLDMDKQGIELPGAAKYGPYSAGVQSNGMFWLSGQIAVEFDDVKSQTQGALDKIDSLLKAANLSRDNICFAQILLADIDDFASMNEVYGSWIDSAEIKPARAAFAAAALPAGALVEIVVQGTR
jgi:2-iminobutanoate/2-iminopropanoate deaminase|tara:strand:+ start:3190 stop:3657 length:468 start_codon:yes stop_codon:yes gene_type:complete